ncbi:response regulator [Pelagicoccus sp. SDUM812003]|uniref:response regulator n=1 Tax=Pelagicoccus sp. SDUM812003 TaxID=3041267 RepID=UPI00280E7F6E|nr:response regulator [Pelagicoccus sp. SDUM812003]MDQ8201547.1 response regulator [Pelagicoccus sp. SDUM812003]
MRLKILTVDDSKTVRIIVKKSFKSFDCEIFEAQNGVEGLAMAAKTTPDIILLDITMPVMDGVEMLTKLKSDPSLKHIPVIMLTAEAGRENVMKIAKIGVRDYIVKPFKEEVLVDKVSRVVDLRPAGEAEPKQKKIDDPIDILIVEDKPAIIEQIKKGFAHTPWVINGVASTGEAIDFCQKKLPDCIIISLSLPDDAAITLFRIVRSNAKTKYVPLFGLSVKTASEEQARAQQAGFSTIIHKPIDFEELEAKIGKAVNLDTSGKYFVIDEDYMTVRLPKACNAAVVNEVSTYLKDKTSQAVDAGISKIIFDAQKVSALNMDVIKLLLHSMKTCRDLSLNYALAGNEVVREESKKFEESKDWKFCDTVESARASL